MQDTENARRSNRRYAKSQSEQVIELTDDQEKVREAKAAIQRLQ